MVIATSSTRLHRCSDREVEVGMLLVAISDEHYNDFDDRVIELRLIRQAGKPIHARVAIMVLEL